MEIFHEEGTGENAIQDFRYTELQRYIEEEDDFAQLEVENRDENEASTSAVEPNRGKKYVGQGKNDTTVWWSMPASSERVRIRTQCMKRNRSEALPFVKQNFNDKVDSSEFYRPLLLKSLYLKQIEEQKENVN